MKAVQKHLGTVMLLLSCAAAQTGTTATVQHVSAVRAGSDLRVEITLSAPVKPSDETAVHPDRILLDLPDTTSAAGNSSVAVNVNGVRRVRIGRHSESPLITRVVLDLDQAHPYSVKVEENRIIVTIAPAENSRTASRGAPVAATTGNLIGLFRRHRDSKPVMDTTAENSAPIAPPPAIAGPAFEPPADNSAAGAVPPLPAPAPQKPPSPASAASGVAQLSSTPAPVASAPTQEVATSSPPAPMPSATPTSASAPMEASNAPEVAKTDEVVEPAPATPAAAPSVAPVTTSTLIARTDDPNLRTIFKVKYVADGVVYLDGGRAQGLAEGMKLEIEDTNLPAKQGDSVNFADPRIVAELEVTGVAETSAVTDIRAPKRPVKVGDLAYLSSGDAEALVQQRTLSATRQYPAVISFTEGDTLDEEARSEVPRPPPPSVNRARGRIGFDTIETISHGTSNVTSSDVGMVFRGDITRIGGTYWNLSGYWRGQLTKASVASQQTLQNLINRTYHLNMTYDNPNSTLVAGFGRLFLPWAPSLDTIDGGYFGKRLSKGSVVGMFGGSTPDPSSWDYSPNRVIGGSFINFEGGEFNGFHYSSTSGAGVSMVNWQMDRPFVFFEDSVSYKRTIAVYESAQLDSPVGNSATPSPGPGLGRNFFTLRVDPHPRVELNFNYNYFRDIPTFDPTLIGTGLLDKYLFQGFSAGGRVEVLNQVWLSTNLGRSSGTGDAKTSLNQMYGISFGRIPFVKIRSDVHYARFNSSFGTGDYEAVSLSRQMSDRLRLEVLLGQQKFASPITTNTRGRFVTGTVETTLGPHYYLQGNFTTNRGDMSYDQLMFSIGYRFDSRRKGE
ncbi:MAG TPA: AMIN domain-containing protein [Candidatus Sulfotelmatobacter sp.]|nr:AMIN domain-containing protein [Candidatus Sulfotelmatobacter sp.]